MSEMRPSSCCIRRARELSRADSTEGGAPRRVPFVRLRDGVDVQRARGAGDVHRRPSLWCPDGKTATAIFPSPVFAAPYPLVPRPTICMKVETSMKTAMSAALLLVLTSCTSFAPGAESVRVANDPKDVAGCRVVGTVHGVWGSDTRMKNDAFSQGADTIFVTNSGWLTRHGKTDGVAYNCSGVDQRMPATVIVKP